MTTKDNVNGSEGESGYAVCPECGAVLAVRRDGLLPVHRQTPADGPKGACAGSARDGAKPRAAYELKAAEQRAAEVLYGEALRGPALAAAQREADAIAAAVEAGCTRRSEALRLAQQKLREARSAFEAL